MPRRTEYNDGTDGSPSLDFLNEAPREPLSQHFETPYTDSELSDEVERHTRAPRQSSRRRRERERAHINRPPHELIRLLVEQEYEATKLRKQLNTAFGRIEEANRRALSAEKANADTIQHFRTLNESRLAGQQELIRVNGDLSLYKEQYKRAQDEIIRAQETLRILERQRYEALEDAARERTRARQLNQERLAQESRDEGHRTGYERGYRRARQDMKTQGHTAPWNGFADEGNERDADQSYHENGEVFHPAPGPNDQIIGSNVPSSPHHHRNPPSNDSPAVGRAHDQDFEPLHVLPSVPDAPIPITEPVPDIGTRTPSVHMYPIDIPPTEELARQYNTNDPPQRSQSWGSRRGAQQHARSNSQSRPPDNFIPPASGEGSLRVPPPHGFSGQPLRSHTLHVNNRAGSPLGQDLDRGMDLNISSPSPLNPSTQILPQESILQRRQAPQTAGTTFLGTPLNVSTANGIAGRHATDKNHRSKIPRVDSGLDVIREDERSMQATPLSDIAGPSLRTRSRTGGSSDSIPDQIQPQPSSSKDEWITERQRLANELRPTPEAEREAGGWQSSSTTYSSSTRRSDRPPPTHIPTNLTVPAPLSPVNPLNHIFPMTPLSSQPISRLSQIGPIRNRNLRRTNRETQISSVASPVSTDDSVTISVIPPEEQAAGSSNVAQLDSQLNNNRADQSFPPASIPAHRSTTPNSTRGNEHVRRPSPSPVVPSRPSSANEIVTQENTIPIPIPFPGLNALRSAPATFFPHVKPIPESIHTQAGNYPTPRSAEKTRVVSFTASDDDRPSLSQRATGLYGAYDNNSYNDPAYFPSESSAVVGRSPTASRPAGPRTLSKAPLQYTSRAPTTK